MRLQARATSVLAAVLMVLGGLTVVSPAAHADTYDPPRGVRFNNPTGTAAQKMSIRRHIIRSIKSAPRGTRIRIMSWNIRSHKAAEALVAAHRRGVTVQLVMDRYNAFEHDPDPMNPIPADPSRNEDWFWMRREFAQNNDRRPGYHSWAALCRDSCRGRGGLPHIKMFLFDRVHDSRDVVIYSSGNFTDAAGAIQWNDAYTVVGNERLYNWAAARFNELAHDRPVAQPWRVGSFAHRIRFGVFPWQGKWTSGDPVGGILNNVRCFGALKGSGNGHGRTVIRISQTGQIGDRGKRLAYKVKALWNQGCDIKMIYSLMSPAVENIYRSGGPRGPMPIRQIAQDFDGDFIYDRYLHQKAFTISGVYGSNHRANYTWNGSANWAGYTLNSDEIFTRLSGPIVRHQYNVFINHWFNHPPRSVRGRLPASYARLAGIDPYAKIQLD